MINVTIKENSWVAKIAARKLKEKKVAMVLGKTIYLHNTSKSEFLLNKRWLRHEIAHVKQFKKFGVMQFLFMYLMETFNNGYDNNRFEVEARIKERDLTILEGVEIN